VGVGPREGRHATPIRAIDAATRARSSNACFVVPMTW
jgi:hypothetical protein